MKKKCLNLVWLLVVGLLILKPEPGPCDIMTFQEDANGYAGTQDTTLHQEIGIEAGTWPAVWVSSSISFDTNQFTRSPAHGLLRFDNITDQIPPGSTINSVILSLQSPNASSNSITVHRMIALWDETNTWSTSLGGNGITTNNNLEARATPDAQFTPTNSIIPFTIDLANPALAATVQAWVDGTPNRGWAFLPTGPDVYRFYSSEDADLLNHPSLLIDFTPPPPITITSQPQSQTVCRGNNATFSVVATGATGSAPLVYQWRFNNTNIAGANNTTYTVFNAQPTNEGSYTVVVTNVNGSVTSTAATLTVRDLVRPQINCPANIITNTDSGRCSKSNVTYTVSATDNCDANVSPTCAPTSGSTFSSGVTIVTCRATDASGNSNQCTFTVTVRDQQPPTITCPPNITTNAAPGLCSQAVAYRPTATNDNCAVSNVFCNPPSGSVFPVGATPVICTATDTSGNTNGCSFTVTVLDTTPPAMSCSDLTVPSTSENGAEVFFSETVLAPPDNCDVDVTVECTPPSGFFPIGTTLVSCSAWDASRNTNRCAFQVTVNECSHSNKGRDFWLTFPANFPDPINPQQLSLTILGPPETTGTVEMEVPHFSTTFAIPPGSMSVSVILPSQADLGLANDTVLTNGVHVTASQPVAVFALNHIDYSTDGYLALPTKVLGTRYVVLSYANVHSHAPDLNGTQFAIVASADNTILDIKPSVTTGARTAGVWFSLTLNRGQTYQLRNTNGLPNDLTGTIIHSDKPIAVFGSHQAAAVPDTNVWFWDYLVEQLLPVPLWGTIFYAQPLATRFNGDRLRILAAAAGTLVAVHDGVTTVQFTLGEGQFREVVLTKPSVITANNHLLLAQYATSSDFDGVEAADPTMILVPSRDHFRTDYMIWTPTNGFTNNFLSLMGFAPTVDIDGRSVTLTPTWLSGIYTGTVAVASGAHSLSAEQPFGVTAYGFAELNAYGYAGGFTLGDPVPPTLNCPTNITTACNTLTGASVSFTASALDNCTPYVDTVCSPPSGSVFPFGSTVVNCTAMDEAGNIASCSFTVRVLKPVLQASLGTFDGIEVLFITWDGNGTLQEADELRGDDGSLTNWVDVPDQLRPYRVRPLGAKRFYRLSGCNN